jgi:MHS family alpha-ketoglutarate permease-like MFS transporter
MTATAEAPVASVPIGFGRRLRSIFGGAVGNLIEWYDWFAYASFSLYFAPSFSRGRPDRPALNTAAVFAVGFLMRPVGGWLLGRYADRTGARRR